MAHLIKLPEGKTHKELFANMLRLTAAGPHEKNEILENIPEKLGCNHDGKKTTVKNLLLSTSIESTTLINTEFYQTVMEGAEPMKCMRNAIPTFRTNAGVLRVPLGETGTYAPKVAEGAEILTDTQDYDSRDFTVYKYGTKPMISQELIDRSMYDVIALEVAKAGARCENVLNQASLSVILENSGNSSDCGGSGATPLKFLAAAQGENTADGFTGDTAILFPTCYAAVVGSLTGTPYGGLADQATRTGTIPNVLGMSTAVCGITDTSATYTWGWGTDNYIGALVLDSRNAGAIAMEKDITVDKQIDVVRQVVNAPVSIRFGVNYLQANAACRVLY